MQRKSSIAKAIIVVAALAAAGTAWAANNKPLAVRYGTSTSDKAWLDFAKKNGFFAQLAKAGIDLQVVVLDQGRVAETGTHDSLLAKGGIYARLVSRQLASVYAPAAS